MVSQHMTSRRQQSKIKGKEMVGSSAESLISEDRVPQISDRLKISCSN